MKARARVLLGAVYLVAVLTNASTVLAADPPVVVGEVGTRVVGDHADLPKELRRALEREIANLVLEQAPRQAASAPRAFRRCFAPRVRRARVRARE